LPFWRSRRAPAGNGAGAPGPAFEPFAASRTIGAVQRVCFLLRVKPERLAEYRAAHKNVWPEMRDALSRHGWHNYSLFLADDGLLVGYVEVQEFQRAVTGMQTEEVNARWQAAMKDLFQPLRTGAADTSLVTLEQVFYLP
jgi:L-rhamnose mutarotase